MTKFKVVDADGVLIAEVTREERNRLMGRNEDNTAPHYGAPELPLFPDGVPIFNQQLIELHRKASKVYYSLVDPSVIRAELRREISRRVPTAEDSVTTKRVGFSNEQGSGRYFEHHDRRSFAYPATAEAMRDRNARRILREHKVVSKVLARERAAYFPLQKAS